MPRRWQVRWALDAGPIGPQTPLDWPSLEARHLNLATPTNTRSSSDHPHTSGASLTGSCAIAPSVPRAPMFYQGSWSKDSSKRPRRQNISPRRGLALPMHPPKKRGTNDIMVVLCRLHNWPCCSALISSCRLLATLVVASVGSARLDRGVVGRSTWHADSRHSCGNHISCTSTIINATRATQVCINGRASRPML
jgi:hypothetical protein